MELQVMYKEFDILYDFELLVIPSKYDMNHLEILPLMNCNASPSKSSPPIVEEVLNPFVGISKENERMRINEVTLREGEKFVFKFTRRR